MRMNKLVLLGMLVATLVLGGAVLATAAGVSSSASANVSFTIPAWISLTVTSGGASASPASPGLGRTRARPTQLRVISTKAWTLSDQILWTSSSLPAGANGVTQSTLTASLARAYTGPGTWGLQNVAVKYTLTLSDSGLANLPAGDYALVVQYTATTNDWPCAQRSGGGRSGGDSAPPLSPGVLGFTCRRPYNVNARETSLGG